MNYSSTIEIYPSASSEKLSNTNFNNKKALAVFSYTVLVFAVVLPYALLQSMQYKMQERDRLVESQLKTLQDRVAVLELRKKTELDSAIYQVTRVQRQLTEQQSQLSARLNALQSALLEHEKQTDSLTESMQYAEQLLAAQQELMTTISEKQTQSDESLNFLHNSMAEKDAILAQLSIQVLNTTMDKNLTAIFPLESLEN